MPSITRTINENAYGTVYSWETHRPYPLGPPYDYPGVDTDFTITFAIPHDVPATHPSLTFVSGTLSFLPIAPSATPPPPPSPAWFWDLSAYRIVSVPPDPDEYVYTQGWKDERAVWDLNNAPWLRNSLNQIEAAAINPAGGSVTFTVRVNNRNGIIYPGSVPHPAPEDPSTIQNFVLNYTLSWTGATSALGQPFNLQDEMGRYHSTSGGGGLVEYRRSDFGTNAVQGWGAVSSINAPSGRTLHNPRVIVDERQTVRLAYAQKKTSDSSWDGVYLADSNDDGRTWETPVLMIEDGKHPTIAIGNDGTFNTVVLAAYVGPDGGPGVITAITKSAGDEDFSDPFNFVDENGDDLVAGDDTFHIQQARDDQSRWMLHAFISGAAGTDQFSSYDEARTWQKVV